jgi:hypothetical protein
MRQQLPLIVIARQNVVSGSQSTGPRAGDQVCSWHERLLAERAQNIFSIIQHG